MNGYVLSALQFHSFKAIKQKLWTRKKKEKLQYVGRVFENLPLSFSTRAFRVKIYHGNLQPAWPRARDSVGTPEHPVPVRVSRRAPGQADPGDRSPATPGWPGGRSTAALSHRLMSPRLIPHCSGAHPLVKTCPAGGPIGCDLA